MNGQSKTTLVVLAVAIAVLISNIKYSVYYKDHVKGMSNSA